MNNNFVIYCHTLKKDGRKYIGITKYGDNPNKRWMNGKGYIKKSKSIYFSNAVAEYGWDAFDHEIIKKNLTQQEAKELENYYVNLYKTNNKEYGFNMTKGGDYFEGKPLSNYQKEKRSELNTGENNPMYGKKHSEESKQKMRNFRFGKHLSNSTKEKLSKSLKGKQAGSKHWNYGHIGDKNPMFGHKHSDITKLAISIANKGRDAWNKGIPMDETTKKKISEKNKGRLNIKRGRPVVCIETGKSYYSSLYASKETGIDNSSITKCCNNKLKSAGGYHWKYIEN